MKLKTNEDSLVKVAVVGEITHPTMRTTYKITHSGEAVVLPSVGGIRYNVHVGDKAVGWSGDHIEPGVSIINFTKPDDVRSPQNTALNVLACVGNKAKVISGDAKGSTGIVIGKHGGIEHVLIDFKPEILEKLVIGDKILIEAYGVGLKLLDFPEIKVMNISPELLHKLQLSISNKKLIVPVTHIIPASIMGSGLGSNSTYSGDYDIQLFENDFVKKYHLSDLRLGDFVAIDNALHAYGRIYKENTLSIGIVVHTDSVISGHGPGVSTVFTGSKNYLSAKIDKNENLAKILDL